MFEAPRVPSSSNNVGGFGACGALAHRHAPVRAAPSLRPDMVLVLADHRACRFSSLVAESLAIQSSALASVLKPVMCSCCPILSCESYPTLIAIKHEPLTLDKRNVQ